MWGGGGGGGGVRRFHQTCLFFWVLLFNFLICKLAPFPLSRTDAALLQDAASEKSSLNRRKKTKYALYKITCVCVCYLHWLVFTFRDWHYICGCWVVKFVQDRWVQREVESLSRIRMFFKTKKLFVKWLLFSFSFNGCLQECVECMTDKEEGEMVCVYVTAMCLQ